MYPAISDWTTFQIELASRIYIELAAKASNSQVLYEHAHYAITAANTFAQVALDAFELPPDNPLTPNIT